MALAPSFANDVSNGLIQRIRELQANGSGSSNDFVEILNRYSALVQLEGAALPPTPRLKTPVAVC